MRKLAANKWDILLVALGLLVIVICARLFFLKYR